MRSLSLSFLAWLAVASSRAGAAPTPFPDLSGERVYVAGVAEEYDLVRDRIGQLEESSPQEYYVVVVRNAGQGQWAARDYCFALSELWGQQARRKGWTFPSDRSVLVVVGVENRQLSALCGPLLQDNYGLRGEDINDKLAEPFFVPHARQDQLARGLVSLIDGFEDWIAVADAQRRHRQEESQTRRAELERDAREALHSAQGLASAVNRELAQQRESGFSVESVEAELAKAWGALSTAEEQLANAPQASLEATYLLAQSLQASLDRLRMLPVERAELRSRIDDLEREARGLEQRADEMRRQKFVVKGVQDRLRGVRQSLDATRKKAPSDPKSARTAAESSRQMLSAITAQLDNLIEQRRQVQAFTAELNECEREFAGQLERADIAGVDTGSIQTRLKPNPRPPADAEYDKQLAVLKAATERVRVQQAELSQLVDAHRQVQARMRFMTRTLPGVIAGIVGFIAVVIAGLMRLTHLRRKSAFSSTLASYRQQLTELRERLDALQERHRLLPFSDLDYEEPMEGATQTLYDEVQEAIGRYRQSWLALAELREKARAQADSEGPLTWRKLKDATRLLVEASAPDSLSQVEDHCAAPLEQLEQAHERAAAALDMGDQAIIDLKKQIQTLQDAGRPASAFESDIAACVARLEENRSSLVTDPVGTRQAADEVCADLDTVQCRAAELLACHQSCGETAQRLEEAAALTFQKRSEGWLLTEPEGNPDPVLARAGEHIQTAQQDLQGGKTESARLSLDEATAQINHAIRLIERHVAAKTFCLEQLSQRADDVRRLDGMLLEAEKHQRDLERDFSADSYHTVADNLPRARSIIATLPEQLSEGRRLASDNVQHYVHAAATLVELQRDIQVTGELLAAVESRLNELLQLRQRCRDELDELRLRAGQVAALLAGHTADRPRCSVRLNAAQKTLALAQQAAGEHHVNWDDIEGRLKDVVADLTRAEQLAREDVRLAEQAAAEIVETEREIHRAESYYQSGVTADVSLAEVGLSQARSHLAAQEYEQAIELANRAEADARQAYTEATRQARIRQQRQQRRREARSMRSPRVTGGGRADADATAAVAGLLDAMASTARQASHGSGGHTKSPPRSSTADSAARKSASQISWDKRGGSSPSDDSGASQTGW